MVREKADRPVFDVMAAICNDAEKDRRVADMDEVIYFPTVLTSYNRASGIGGLARQRVMIVHGPEQVGKTTFAMAMGVSAYRHLHAVIMDDTERAAEKEWYNSIIPFAKLEHSKNLDDMRDGMHGRMDRLIAKKNARKKADRLSQDAGCLEIVDTITKLMPRDIVKKIEKEGIDKMYPYQALWISTWMKEIVNRLHESVSTLILVLQERKNLDAFSRKRYTLPGGQSLKYDNCLRVRVTHTKKVEQAGQLVGVQSFYKVENNKIDGTTFEEGSFFTSNGKGDMPKGLDLIRECIQELRYREYAKRDGDWVKIKMPDWKHKFKGGWEDLRMELIEKPGMFDSIVDMLNAEVRR